MPYSISIVTPFMIHSSRETVKPKTLSQMIKDGDYISANFYLNHHAVGVGDHKHLPELEEFWTKLEEQYQGLTPNESLNSYRINLLKCEWNMFQKEWRSKLQNIFSKVHADKAG